MMTPARIVRTIGIAALIGWMGMVGWVAKTTMAQNGGQSPAPLPPVASVDPAPVAPQADVKPQRLPGDALLDAPGAGSAGKAARPADATSSPPLPMPVAAKTGEPPAIAPALADAPAAASAVSVPSAPLAAASGLTVPSPLPAAPAESQSAPPSDDPEQAARTFVERNQREAEEHLKALTDEAQQLRARLAKLESGIKKWQALVTALKGSQAQSVNSAAITPGAEDAGDLEPIRPAGPGGMHSDKRVKWASASAATAAADMAPAAQPQPVANPEPAVQVPVVQPAQVLPGPR